MGIQLCASRVERRIEQQVRVWFVVLNLFATLSGTRFIQLSFVVALCTTRFNVLYFFATLSGTRFTQLSFVVALCTTRFNVLNFFVTLSGTRFIQLSFVVALCTTRFNVLNLFATLSGTRFIQLSLVVALCTTRFNVLNFFVTLSGTRFIQLSFVVALCTTRFNVKECDIMPTECSVYLSAHSPSPLGEISQMCLARQLSASAWQWPCLDVRVCLPLTSVLFISQALRRIHTFL